MGPKFTLYEVKDGLNERTRPFLLPIFCWLLHLRPADMSQPFWSAEERVSIKEGKDLLTGKLLEHLASELAGAAKKEMIFNQRVMQVLLESDFLRHWLGDHGGAIESGPSSARGGKSEGRGGKSEQAPRTRRDPYSGEYANMVASLLTGKSTSASLKSSLCRQLIARPPGADSLTKIGPALVDVLKTSSSHYAQTCVCAALVAVSKDNEALKNLLFAAGKGRC